MNNNIEVWHTNIKIPDLFKEKISKLKNEYADLRLGYGVMPISINSKNVLLTDGICPWHDDLHVEKEYSLLFIVRNDTNSYIESKDVSSIKDQPSGTMVLLNIWKKHRLWNSKGIRSPKGIYLAVCVDLEELPASRKECESLMRKYLKQDLRCAV